MLKCRKVLEKHKKMRVGLFYLKKVNCP